MPLIGCDVWEYRSIFGLDWAVKTEKVKNAVLNRYVLWSINKL